MSACLLDSCPPVSVAQLCGEIEKSGDEAVWTAMGVLELARRLRLKR